MKNVVKKLKQTLKYSGTLLGFLILLNTVAYGQQVPEQQYSCSAHFLRSERNRIRQDIERQLVPQMQEYFEQARQVVEQVAWSRSNPGPHIPQLISCINIDDHAFPITINGNPVAIQNVRVCGAIYDPSTHNIVRQNTVIIDGAIIVSTAYVGRAIIPYERSVRGVISNTLYQLYPRCHRRSDEGGGSGNGVDGLRGAQSAPQRAARTVSAFTSTGGSDGAL